jgi:ferredoxin
MKIVVDRTLCGALGMCEELAPEYFEVKDDGVMAVLKDDVSPEDLDRIHDAVARCPRQALDVR